MRPSNFVCLVMLPFCHCSNSERLSVSGGVRNINAAASDCCGAPQVGDIRVFDLSAAESVQAKVAEVMDENQIYVVYEIGDYVYICSIQREYAKPSYCK